MLKVLEQAGSIVSKKWRGAGKGWKVILVIVVVILSILGIVGLFLWMLGKLVQAISSGGFRNKELYIPKMGYRRR